MKYKEIQLDFKNKSFYVATILDEKRLIITGGANKNVNPKAEFAIVGKDNVLLKHPRTGEILDEFANVKKIMIVDEVFDKYTILKTRNIDDNSDALSYLTKMQFEAVSPKKTKTDSIRFDSREVNNIFSDESNDVVHIGDPVAIIY